jgi:hypothetical protein
VDGHIPRMPFAGAVRAHEVAVHRGTLVRLPFVQRVGNTVVSWYVDRQPSVQLEPDGIEPSEAIRLAQVPRLPFVGMSMRHDASGGTTLPPVLLSLTPLLRADPVLLLFPIDSPLFAPAVELVVASVLLMIGLS